MQDIQQVQVLLGQNLQRCFQNYATISGLEMLKEKEREESLYRQAATTLGDPEAEKPQVQLCEG